MNDKKICFITCVNDEEMYRESVLYIKHLFLPEKFEIDFIAIRTAKCLTKSYNQAMRQSDAKYKVYLHQDVFIVNKNFIRDILNVFQQHEEIGMLGVAGTEKMPPVGFWWQSDFACQHVSIYDNASGKMNKVENLNCLGDYAKVTVIDGLIMATQYDVAWREDIFDGWHFYDMSQSIEFLKAGYQVVVPNQAEPWCIHECGYLNLDKEYEKYRNIFLDEYSSYVFPLVSILIPTYNRPEYFKIAFESAIHQTYRNIEVIVCDNSTNEETAHIMEPYLDNPRVTYLRNRDAKTKEENFQVFKEIVKGEYINWLMDDDVLDPNKIAIMMQLYLEHDEVSLITSCRQWIDAEGSAIESRILKLDCERTTSFNGREIGKKMLLTMANFIGEPTTVLIRRSLLEHHYWNADCRGYKVISDVVMWLELLSKGKMVYIAEPLSSFRSHQGQEQAGINVVLLSRIEWFEITKEAYEIGYFIETLDEYKLALICLLKDSVGFLKALAELKNELDIKLYRRYKAILREAVKFMSECT